MKPEDFQNIFSFVERSIKPIIEKLDTLDDRLTEIQGAVYGLKSAQDQDYSFLKMQIDRNKK